MIKSDFKFEKFEPEYQDYYFKVKGETQDELTHKYMEQSMVCVSSVIYSKVDDIVVIQQMFPFNYSVVESKDEKLKQLLLEMIDELGDVN